MQVGADTWTTAFEYTGNELTKIDFGPAYYEFDYSPESRLSGIAIRKGTDPPIPLTSIDYGNGIDAPAHLPVRIERYPDAQSAEVIEYRYGFHANQTDIAWIEAKVEAELTTENGPGGHYYWHAFFNDQGQLTWTRDADDSFARAEFDPTTGQPTLVQFNADPDVSLPDPDDELPDLTGLNLNGPFLGRHGEGGTFTTQYAYDLAGSLLSLQEPGGNTTRFTRELRTIEDRPGVAYFAAVALPHTDGTNFAGPAAVTWYSAGGRVLGDGTYALVADAGSLYASLFGGAYDFELGSELTRARLQRSYSGLLESFEAWHNLDPDFEESYVTKYFYDGAGRLSHSLNPNRTVARYTYDDLHRVTRTEVGLPAAGTDDPDEPTMRTVGAYTYGGPEVLGRLLQVDLHAGGAVRTTRFTYDWRDRLIYVENPEAPHAFAVYDDLNRVVEGALFDAPIADPETLVLAQQDLTRTRYVSVSYGQRGLPYRSAVAIDAEDLTSGMLESDIWYDPVGQVIASRSPGAATVKTSYDGLGRATTVYVTDGRDDANYTDYYDAGTYKAVVANNVVLEQTEYDYAREDEYAGAYTGLIELITAKQRSHDVPSGASQAILGALDGYGPEHISTYASAFYDFADRVVRTINYGTNRSDYSAATGAGDVPAIDLAATPWPDPSATPDPDPATWTLIGAFGYHPTRGLLDTIVDPKATEARLVYDDLERPVAVIENRVNGDVYWDAASNQWVVTGQEPGEKATDRITRALYDGLGNVVEEIAYTPDSQQSTRYEYQARTADGSTVNSNDLLTRVVFPDTESELDDHSIQMAWNELGEVIRTRDQNGTEHEYEYDLLGRVLFDRVVQSPNPDIDTTVKAIGVHYLDAGPVSYVTSFDTLAPTIGELNGEPTFEADEVVNQVKLAYDSLWQLDQLIQAPTGPVTPSSHGVDYDYTVAMAGAGNLSRLDTVTYPDTSVVQYWYGGAGDADDRISRIAGLGFGLDVLYEYLGLGTVAIVDYAAPDVQLDRFVHQDGRRIPGTYHGYDKFGRVVRHLWIDGDFDDDQFSAWPTVPPIVQHDHRYDNVSNRLETLDGRPGAKQAIRDRVFAYDLLDRLAEVKRGVKLGETLFSHGGGSQSWDLGMLGNWSSVSTDADASGTYDTDEADERTHNDVNEIDQRIFRAHADLTVNLVHDKAGNLRTSPVPNGLGGSIDLTYTHDAWNRLVRVDYGLFTRAEFTYNGLGHCVTKRADTDLNGTLDQLRERYYSGGWQLLEERIDEGLDGTVDRHLQYLWGVRYVDDLVLRREDGDPVAGQPDYTGVNDSYWYHLTDVQFSTVAVMDAAGEILERVAYNAYGQPRHHWRSDLDGDGDVDAADAAIMNAAAIGSPAIGDAAYNVDADLNRDGRVNSRDVTIFNGDGTAWALPDGALSAADVDNVIGFSGYVYNAGALLYSVRFRCDDTNLGRWLERDPAGYVDGMNLYEYVGGAPLNALDPLGLCASDDLDPSDYRRPPKEYTRPAPGLGAGFSRLGPGDPGYDAFMAWSRGWRQVTPIERESIALEVGWASLWGLGSGIVEEVIKPQNAVSIVLMVVPGGVFVKIGGKGAAIIGAAAGRALAAARLRHARAVKDLVDHLIRQGVIVHGTEIAVRTPFGRRIIDVVIEVNGKFYGLEMKTGRLIVRGLQRIKDRWINKHGAPFVKDPDKILEKNIPIGPLKN